MQLMGADDQAAETNPAQTGKEPAKKLKRIEFPADTSQLTPPVRLEIFIPGLLRAFVCDAVVPSNTR